MLWISALLASFFQSSQESDRDADADGGLQREGEYAYEYGLFSGVRISRWLVSERIFSRSCRCCELSKKTSWMMSLPSAEQVAIQTSLLFSLLAVGEWAFGSRAKESEEGEEEGRELTNDYVASKELVLVRLDAERLNILRPPLRFQRRDALRLGVAHCGKSQTSEAVTRKKTSSSNDR